MHTEYYNNISFDVKSQIVFSSTLISQVSR